MRDKQKPNQKRQAPQNPSHNALQQELKAYSEEILQTEMELYTQQDRYLQLRSGLETMHDSIAKIKQRLRELREQQTRAQLKLAGTEPISSSTTTTTTTSNLRKRLQPDSGQPISPPTRVKQEQMLAVAVNQPTTKAPTRSVVIGRRRTTSKTHVSDESPINSPEISSPEALRMPRGLFLPPHSPTINYNLNEFETCYQQLSSAEQPDHAIKYEQCKQRTQALTKLLRQHQKQYRQLQQTDQSNDQLIDLEQNLSNIQVDLLRFLVKQFELATFTINIQQNYDQCSLQLINLLKQPNINTLNYQEIITQLNNLQQLLKTYSGHQNNGLLNSYINEVWADLLPDDDQASLKQSYNLHKKALDYVTERRYGISDNNQLNAITEQTLNQIKELKPLGTRIEELQTAIAYDLFKSYQLEQKLLRHPYPAETINNLKEIIYITPESKITKGDEIAAAVVVAGSHVFRDDTLNDEQHNKWQQAITYFRAAKLPRNDMTNEAHEIIEQAPLFNETAGGEHESPTVGANPCVRP